MAKPRTVKLGSGVVKLHGFSKEEADAIQSVLKSYKNKELPVDLETAETPKIQYASESLLTEDEFDNTHVVSMTETALGLHFNKNTQMYEVVELKYDPVSGDGEVVDRVNAGTIKGIAHEKFKTMVVMKGIIKK